MNTLVITLVQHGMHVITYPRFNEAGRFHEMLLVIQRGARLAYIFTQEGRTTYLYEARIPRVVRVVSTEPIKYRDIVNRDIGTVI